MLTEEPVVPILLATDLAASRRFSEEVLGLPVQQASESTVTYAWGGQPRLRLSASSEGTKDSQTQTRPGSSRTCGRRSTRCAPAAPSSRSTTRTT